MTVRTPIAFWIAILAATACHIEHGDRPDPPPDPPTGAPPRPPEPPPVDPGVLAVEHVSVLSMELGSVPLLDATVLIRDQRITWIGAAASAQVPAGATRIDGRGRWLLPGLVDAHVHIENPRLVRLMLQEPTIEENAISDADSVLPYVAFGVLQIGNLSAMSEAVGQRRAVETGGILGPHMMLSALVDGDPPAFPNGVSRVAATPEDGRQMVRDAIVEGYDMIKVYSRLTFDAFTAIVDEARQRGVKVVGHLPGRGTPVDPYFQPGFTMIAHAEELAFRAIDDSDAEVARIVALAAQHRTGLTTTLTVDHRILEQTLDPTTIHTRPEVRLVHPLIRRFWYERNPYIGRNTPERIARLQQVIAFNDKIVRAFVAAGLPVVAGTDALVAGVVAGSSLHDELVALVAAGLTPYQALDAATRVPTTWMGVGGDRGTVTIGKRADLLLLDADPLADISNTRRISGVIANGRWLPRADLDNKLAALAARYEGVSATLARAPRATTLPPIELEALLSGAP
jgi:imidazolonepropionase-like amidohydrolase